MAASDYSDDLRIGPEILKTFVETYRKLRNTLRWMLGALAHLEPGERVKFKDMSEFELERLMLHRLTELDAEVRDAYADLRLSQGRRRAVAVHEHRTCRRSISTSARTRSTASPIRA